MEEKKVRGSVINGYLKFVEKTWGEDGMLQCRKDVGLADATIKDGKLYPIRTHISISTWIGENQGTQYMRKAGKFTIMNLGMLAYLVRFASIETMLKKAKSSYMEAYNFGEVNIDISPNHATIRMKDVSQIENNCLGWTGAFEGLLELTKTKGRVIKTKCQLKGDEQCEYEMDWE